MSYQTSFAELDYNHKKRLTRREVFLNEMEQTVPWLKLAALIAPAYPTTGRRGRQPMPLDRMLRIHCMQNWFSFSDRQFEREYPQSTPPSTSQESVKKGFLAFRQHCIKCHAINGDGGNIGPELNYPVSVTEYWRPEWLVRFIADPQSVRANSKMIPFYRDVGNREQLIADIVEYLKVMASRKPLNR